MEFPPPSIIGCMSDFPLKIMKNHKKYEFSSHPDAIVHLF